MTQTILNVIDQIDFDIEVLAKEDPLRSWNKFFSSFNSLILREYKKLGRFRKMLFAQYTDASMVKILNSFRDEYSFIGYDFNDLTGTLILKNLSTNKFESIFIGEHIAEMVFEVGDKIEQIEKRKLKISKKK